MDKGYILDELKRTALESGGAPLGRRAFVRETGIRVSDWEGKHWARWGDALLEAGFSPNEMKTAYAEETLLSSYAHFTRELGRLPVSQELRLKARSDKTFPSNNTFARFGPKRDLVQRLMLFCQETSGFDDVLALCIENAGARPSGERTGATQASEERLGFVYLIRSGRFYKIGKSNAAGRRVRELAIQLPEKATTVHVIRTDDPSGIEDYWHRRFTLKRKNGEWFDLTASDVQLFKRRKFM